MPAREVSVAAATAILGYDLLSNQNWRSKGVPRVLTGIGMTGSAAAGDTAIDLFIGDRKVATIFNTVTGFPTGDHVKPLLEGVPPGEQIAAIITDAAATNPINLVIVEEVLG